MNWFFRLRGLGDRIKAVWDGVILVVNNHPELSADANAVYHKVLDSLENRDLASVESVVERTEIAFKDFVKAYTAETASGAVADLVAKLKSVIA